MPRYDRPRARRPRSEARGGEIIDSQSVKTTEAGGPRGYDAGKKINGRKRHALVDMDGRALLLEPHLASVQDRDRGGRFLRVSRALHRFAMQVFADSGDNHERVEKDTNIVVEIVRKIANQVGFVVLPRRWGVERFFAWINRNRRLAKDFAQSIRPERFSTLLRSCSYVGCIAREA